MSLPTKPSLWAGGISVVLMLLILCGKLAGDNLYAYADNPDLTVLKESSLITCLAGGKGRIRSSLRLFVEGTGGALFIAGAGPRATRKKILREYLPEDLRGKLTEERRNRIYVETRSRNTIGNAYVVDRFLRNNPNFKNLILVTSAYHMRRSLLIMENAVGEKIKIHPYTAEEGSFHRDNWTSSLNGINVTLKEYSKLFLARIFIPLLETF